MTPFTKKSTRPVALVTGAGRRLGRQIALALAKNGYNVVINYKKSKDGAMQTVRDARNFGVDAIAIKADISKKTQVARMTSKAVQKFGGIDVLVNNASIYIDGSFLLASEKIWRETIDINLTGIFLCSQSVAPYMLKQKHGCIVNIASLGGIQAWSKHVAYSVSKAGSIMLTKCMAKELSPYVMVNAIAPGVILIPKEEQIGVKHISVDKIPLKKYGKPSDICDLVLFLATKSSYITGQIFVVDGGRSINQG